MSEEDVAGVVHHAPTIQNVYSVPKHVYVVWEDLPQGLSTKVVLHSAHTELPAAEQARSKWSYGQITRLEVDPAKPVDPRHLSAGLYRLSFRSGTTEVAMVGADEGGDRWYVTASDVEPPNFDWNSVIKADAIHVDDR